MLRIAALLLVTAAPAVAVTCQDYVSMMRQEGIRTLIKAECVTPEDARKLNGHWNEILAGPLGSCLVSRAISGDPNVAALTVYMKDMNRQKAEQGCPPEKTSVGN